MFRDLFYSLPYPTSRLIGRDVFWDWMDSRNNYEIENRAAVISFIRHFNVSREEFREINDAIYQRIIEQGFKPNSGALAETYDVDFIFDLLDAFEAGEIDELYLNTAINYFFLWRNSPHEREQHRGPQGAGDAVATAFAMLPELDWDWEPEEDYEYENEEGDVAELRKTCKCQYTYPD